VQEGDGAGEVGDELRARDQQQQVDDAAGGQRSGAEGWAADTYQASASSIHTSASVHPNVVSLRTVRHESSRSGVGGCPATSVVKSSSRAAVT